MSVRVMAVVFDRFPVGGGLMILALALADHAHDDGNEVRPSVAKLAIKTRQSERTVQYQLGQLREMGWLQVVAFDQGGRAHPTVYRINADWLKGAEIAPFIKGAKSRKGCNPAQERVQNDVLKGATAIAPESKRTIREPSSKSARKGSQSRRMPETVIPDDFEISKSVARWAAENGFNRLDEHLAHFRDKCRDKDYRSRDWDAKFRNAIRDDWAGLRKQGGANGAGNPAALKPFPKDPGEVCRWR